MIVRVLCFVFVFVVCVCCEMCVIVCSGPLLLAIGVCVDVFCCLLLLI